MTIICFKDGIMAADSAVWLGETIRCHVKKIWRTDTGRLVSAAGVSAECESFRRWVSRHMGALSGSKYDLAYTDDEDCCFEGLIVDPHDGVFLCDYTGIVERFDAQCVALGAACDLALGAMLGGASAEEAVRIAIDNHQMAGGRVQVEHLHPNPNVVTWNVAEPKQ